MGYRPEDNEDFYQRVIGKDSKGTAIKTKNKRQSELATEITRNSVTFASGSAGTGKTFVAIAMGVEALLNGECKKLVLLRPAVEAGKSMGFLPGDLNDKIAPYLQPFVDSLLKILGPEKYNKFNDDGKIEMGPINFKRGTTQNDFVILDEAQNCTRAEMEMFITRLGHHGKYVITGDGSQADIKLSTSGFDHAIEILSHIDGISTVQFTEDDIVRHRIVKEAIIAYKRDREVPFRKQGVESNLTSWS
jgi:phosphate starvation-inducible PhoH-like protein